MPPFAALRAFHIAARTEHFARAASELNLTQSAVSHQIRRLEGYLGTKLFDRAGARVVLTEAGHQYFAAVDPAIERIQQATLALRGPSGRKRVTLTTLPSIVAMWLIPNWASFEQACPGIDVQFLTTTRVVDLRREQVDLALRYGGGSWPGLTAQLLFVEGLVPVSRPGYLTPEQAADPVAALENARLMLNDTDPDEWAKWARARELPPPRLNNALHFPDSQPALQAAERGLGLAMGRRPLIDSHLASGTLEAPFGAWASDSDGCYLCYQEDRELPAHAARMVDWLQDLAARNSGSDAGNAPP